MSNFHSLVFPYYDEHLTAAILVWLIQTQTESKKEARECLDALLKAHPALSWVYTRLNEEVPAACTKAIEEVTKEYLSLEEVVSPLATCLMAVKAESGGDANRRNLAEWNKVWQERKTVLLKEMQEAIDKAATPEAKKEAETAYSNEAKVLSGEFGDLTSLDSLRAYARAFYRGGDYLAALYRTRFYLDCVCDLVSEAYNDETAREEFLCGSVLSSCMLMKDVQTSFDMSAVPQYILQLSETCTPKTYPFLVHWTTWIIFKYLLPNQSRIGGQRAWNDMCEFYLSEKSLQVMLSSCPHLFRYVAAYLLMAKSTNTSALSTSALNFLQQSAHVYSDSVTKFVISVMGEQDVDAAQTHLKELVKISGQDFFLSQQIAQQAKLTLFHNYCAIHASIDLKTISESLEMDAEEAEKWVATLIKDSKLDAKIDSEKNVITMSSKVGSTSTALLEQTSNLITRTQNLVQQLEKISA